MRATNPSGRQRQSCLYHGDIRCSLGFSYLGYILLWLTPSVKNVITRIIIKLTFPPDFKIMHANNVGWDIPLSTTCYRRFLVAIQSCSSYTGRAGRNQATSKQSKDTCHWKTEYVAKIAQLELFQDKRNCGVMVIVIVFLAQLLQNASHKTKGCQTLPELQSNLKEILGSYCNFQIAGFLKV